MQKLTRTEYRADYDSFCFGVGYFQTFVQPCRECVCLRPGRELPKFLLDTCPGLILSRAANHCPVAPILCGEREPVLHTCPDSLKRRCTHVKLFYNQVKSWRQYFSIKDEAMQRAPRAKWELRTRTDTVQQERDTLPKCERVLQGTRSTCDVELPLFEPLANGCSFL